MSDVVTVLPIDPVVPSTDSEQSEQDEPVTAESGGQEQPAPKEPASVVLQDAKNLGQPIDTSAPTKFLRGPLRYDVDTSSPQLEAGRAFSVVVRVTNPYESAVILLDVSAALPTEFRDRENQDIGFWKSIGRRFKEELQTRIVAATNVIAPKGAQSESTEVPSSQILLQHGNSALKRFTFKTWRSTLFVPAVYILQFQVQYKIDGILNQDTIRKEFNIRAPLRAVLWGAFWGAIVGSGLRALYTWLEPAKEAVQSIVGTAAVSSPSQLHLWLSFLGEILAGILLGGVLVVAFARKKDAQPFISIEDFYGGFFVGFSAGYVGKSLLAAVLKGIQ